jgi:hypothetical protein
MSQTIAPVLAEPTVKELREAVRGEIVTSEDDGYAEACRIWNSAHESRRPALIVLCSAFAERSMPFLLNAVTGWHDPAVGAAHRDWARTAIAAASEASTGRAYVNYLGDPDAARTSYGDQTYARLVSLKTHYDPTNVFRLNQNIEPQPRGS